MERHRWGTTRREVTETGDVMDGAPQVGHHAKARPVKRSRTGTHAVWRGQDKPWHLSHPMVRTRLDSDTRDLLHGLLRGEQQTFNAWLRDRINEQLLARNPDSQGAVKKVIAEDFALDLWEKAQDEADKYYRLAQKLPKRVAELPRKRELLALYGRWCDHAAFLSGVISQYQEVRAKLDTGQIRARHRPRVQDEDPELPENREDTERWLGG